MMKNEWKRLFTNRFLIIALIAIITIPSLYTTIFLSSMWDPYGKVSNLPVAVVNEDRAVSYHSGTVHVGDDFISQLKKSDALKFSFVDRKAAEQGLKKGIYYMVVTIPEDFSADAVTLMDPVPQKMELHYDTNPGINFIASKMCESAMVRMKEELSQSVTAFYAKNLLSQFQPVESGFQSAAEGSGKLDQAFLKIKSGQQKITGGLHTLSTGMTAFTAGTGNLQSGMTQYASGVSTVNTGAGTLLSGAGKLSDGLGQLNGKVSQISLSQITLSDSQKSDISSAASSGAAPYAAVISENIAGGIASSLQAGLTAGSTADSVTTEVEQNAQIQQMEAVLENAGYTPDQARQTVYAIVSGTLHAAAGQITADSLNSSVLPGLTGAAGKIASSAALAGAGGVVDQVNGTISSFQGQIQDLKKAVQSLSDGAVQVNNGARALSDGTGQLAAQSGALVQGAADLNAHAGQISNAVTSLDKGSAKIGAGLSAAEKGNAQLTDSLYHGMYELDSSTRNFSGQTVKMIADPVQMDEGRVTTVDNNGSSMAAYMMTVALWVAGLAFCMIYPIDRDENDKKAGFIFWTGKASVMYPLSAAYSLLMVAALYYMNGFRPARMQDTVLTACLSAAAFVSLLYLFNVVLKKAGTYFMFIFMVVQLSGSMGTYPSQLSAPFVSEISSYLPFTYAIRAFRSAISGGNSIHAELMVLWKILLWTVVLTWLFYFLTDCRKYRIRKKGEENPVITETLTNEKNMLY